MRYLLFFSILLNTIFIKAQSVRDYAVELSVKTTDNPAAISLHWASDAKAIKYYIFRKSLMDLTWVSIDSSLTGIDSVYTDKAVSVGKAYEYWVCKSTKNWVAHGYIYAGINMPARDEKGTALLLIDSNYISPLQKEIAQYKNDLENDGWKIKTFSVLRNDKIQDVKSIIYQEWLKDSVNLKSVILLGNIPVPYSGDIAPDGHPDHEGAWPADVYYTTFDLAWTDNQVNISVASRNENKNVIGDGKFDQSYIWPALSKIPLGRIDLTKMTAFGMSDTLLTKQYLNKNHLYRIGKLQAEKRGLIDDNFGVFGGEAFASLAYRNFSTMFSSSVSTDDYRTTLGKDSYLFSYGCGGGSYTSCSGIGNTNDFVNDSLLNPFTMLFGSYFLDWDSENNYLRAPLASKGWGLVSMAGGRPYAMFHHMSLGEPLGLASVCGQNAYPMYKTGMYDFGTYIHIALMGDPTLTLFTAPLPENLKAETTCASPDVLLSWKQNTSVDSFRIYKLNYQTNHYDYIISIPSSDTSYNDMPGAGLHDYAVRTIQNEVTPSGNFFNIGMMEKISVISYEPLQSKIYFDSSIHYCKNDSFIFIDSTVHPLLQSRSWQINQEYFYDSILKFPLSENGDHTFYLKNKTSRNCECIDSFTLNIRHFLKTDFTISDTVICLNEEFKITPQNITNVDSVTLNTFPVLPSKNSGYEFDAGISGNVDVTLIYRDAYQCADSMTKSLLVNPLPFTNTSYIYKEWKTDSCFDTHELLLEYPNASSNENYLWTLGDGDSVFNASSLSKKYDQAGNYQIRLLAEDKLTNCKADIKQNIRVYENPLMTNIVYSWLTDSCLNTNELELNYQMDTATQTYIWFLGEGDSSINQSVISKKFSSEGAHLIQLKTVDNISGCSSGVQQNINVYPNPAKPNIYVLTNPVIEKKQVNIKSDHDAGLIYHWNSDGNLIISDSLHKIIFFKENTGSSFISLVVTNAYGCPSDSAFIDLQVLVNRILKTDNSLFNIYPNPTNKFLEIDNQKLLKGDFYINDISGKIYKTGKIETSKNQLIDLDEMASGIYFLHINSVENKSTYKIIIEK